MIRKFLIYSLIVLVVILFGTLAANAQNPPAGIDMPSISVNIDTKGATDAAGGGDLVLSLQVLAVMTVLTLAPSILIMMTCFTRIIIVFHFLRQALGTMTQPPNQLLTGLALFLTFFVMQPVFNEANEKGITPYMQKQITQSQAVDNIIQPFRTFMLKHTREQDLGLFIKLSSGKKPNNVNEVSIWTIIPAYSLSELRIAFQIGFLLFIPFLVLDMVIASALMSLGMFLLPPQLISLPIKVLLFILVDGWYLVIDSLMQSILRQG